MDEAEHLASGDKWIMIYEYILRPGQSHLENLSRKVLRSVSCNFNWPELSKRMLLTATSAP